MATQTTSGAALPDLSLPATIPEIPRQNQVSDPEIAVYALCELSPRELNALRNLCQASYFDTNHEYLNDDDPQDCKGHKTRDVAQVCRLPPKATFPGGSLRDIIAYHAELCADKELGKDFENDTIIVAVHRDFKNRKPVLLVHLRSNHDWIDAHRDEGGDQPDDPVWRPDRMWVKAEESACLGVNIQIANMDWYEIKDSEEEWQYDDEEQKKETEPTSRI